jgi:uncharacterized membrane protein YccC
MISLSTRAKEAIKTGLAMVIVFAIAFLFGWDKPEWAGIAVAMVSLPGIGQSLNKGARRIAGTLLGAMAGLFYLGLFPQDRWWLVACYSLHLGVCAYMLTGKKNPYFWHVTSFVALTVIVNTSGTSEGAFEAAMARLEENAMGILVYTLIAVFLWPRNSMGQLKETSCKLFAIQGQLYRTYRELMAGRGTAEEVRSLRMQEAALLPKVGQTLEAAESDSHEVFALRDQWRRFHHLSMALEKTLERWCKSFPEIQSLDLPGLLPNLELFLSELNLRFEETERLLMGEVPTRLPSSISLFIDKNKILALSPFQRAAVVLIKTELERLERLSQSLFDCVLDIRGDRPPVSIPPKEESPHGGIAIDPDRFRASIRMVTHLWIVFLIWVYIDPPGHASFVYLSIVLGQAALMSGGSARTMLLPFAVGSAGVGLVYVFVMPHLSGYAELAVLIFSFTFAIYYLFAQPQQGMARLGAMLPFIVFTSLQNQQTYSFADYANSTAMILLVITILIATEYLFTSPRPEKVFLRLLTRFFRHSEFCMSRLASDWGKKQRLAELWKTAYYHNDLLEIPEKLAKCGKQIDYRIFPNNTPEQVQALVTSLQALAYRIKALVDAREYQQAEPLLRLLHDDLRAWRIKLENRFHRWAENPTEMPEGDLQVRLAGSLASMEECVKETHDLAGQEDLNEEDYKNFYRLLGSFRSLTESVVWHVRIAEQFDFGQWREARF